jgi:hypothetical protein
LTLRLWASAFAKAVGIGNRLSSILRRLLVWCLQL